MAALESLLRNTSRCIFIHRYFKKNTLFLQKRHIQYSSARHVPINMAYASYQTTDPQKMNNLPPVVIMHGLLGSKMNWKSLAKAINARTRRHVYTVDARNHGDSPHTDDMSYPLMAEDLLHFLKEIKCEKAVLMGHSMGGRAVMAAALIEPSIVEKLIVLDISPLRTSSNISTIPLFLKIMRNVRVPPDLNISQARAYVNELLATVVPEEAVRQFLLTNLMRTDTEYSWKYNVEAISKHFNPNISSFQMKDNCYFEGETSFIGGTLSDYLRPEDEETIQDMFPLATFHYLEGAGHWLHSDKPTEFLDLLVPLLQE